MTKINIHNIAEEIENKISDQIAMGAAGRLVTFKPEKKPQGVDLVVERRGKYKEKPISFIINTFMGPTKSEKLTKDFLQNDFKADKNLYLLFATFDEVKQKISDYIWLVPSLQFVDIAEITKTSNGESFLKFEVPSDIKSKNKYSKFLVLTKEIGKLSLDALEAGGKFNFQEVSFEEKKTVNLERLKEFISEARRNTYASSATPIDNPRLLGSVQLEFQKGDFFYRDVYFTGDKKVIGQEAIYQNSKIVWGMSYLGSTIGKVETSFLKESLFKLSEKCRLNQPCDYEKREFKYTNEGQGTLEEFFGQEHIFLDKKDVYKLTYQGGLI